MANITRETLGNLHEKITITLTPADYNPAFEKALKEYGKSANISGFRKGMVPSGLIKKMYGQSVFEEQIFKTLDKTFNDYLEKEKIEFFAQPLPVNSENWPKTDMQTAGDYTYSFELGLRPTITVADVKASTFTKYKIAVEPKVVTDEIENQLKRNGNFEEVDTITSDENAVDILFEEITEAEEKISKDIYDNVKTYSNTARNLLMGKKKGDSFEIALEDAFETKELETKLPLLGLEKGMDISGSKFTCTIKKVSLLQPAELNAEFFEKMYPGKNIETEEAFKTELNADFEKYYERQAMNTTMDEVYHYWMDKTEVALPEAFLKNWIKKGEEGKAEKTDEEVEKEFPGFVKGLKWTLISNTLANQNDIQVKQDDIKNYAINQLMGYYGGGMQINPEEAWVQDFANNMSKDKKFVEGAVDRIVQNKIFDWAETQIATTDKTISLDEFKKMNEEHKH
jgi:trigger factor